MGLFYGPIGFVNQVEDPKDSGIYVEVPEEKHYRGEIRRNMKRWDDSDKLNPNLNISNTISIIADPYISNHLNSIRYVKWLGGYWEISSVDVESPRLILSIGGVYNGPTVGASSDSEEHPRVE